MGSRAGEDAEAWHAARMAGLSAAVSGPGSTEHLAPEPRYVTGLLYCRLGHFVVKR